MKSISNWELDVVTDWGTSYLRYKTRRPPRFHDRIWRSYRTDELDVVVAHRGVIRWTLSTEGKASHSSRPELGNNAIYRMAKVIDVVRAMADELGNTIHLTLYVDPRQ